MQIPLQITVRGVAPSEALEKRIRDKAAKLDEFFEHVMSCRVVVEAPHKHHHQGKQFNVRIEIPGMEKKDCRITIENNMLYLNGEKRYERETYDSTCHVMERAYGAFQRTIPLPRNVDADKAEASYKNGVLSISLPKGAAKRPRPFQCRKL